MFNDDRFMLNNETGVFLYNEYSKDVPIFDYHCHLEAKDISEDKLFENITQIWLYGDHYKWRLMRAFGIDEELITGNADDYDKFKAWCKVIPYAIGNPLYHWSHLEMKRYFDFDDPINEENALVLWNKCNEILNKEKITPSKLIRKSNVKILCTTNEPIDDLKYHGYIKQNNEFKVKVYPAMRLDKVLSIDNSGFGEYIEKLSQISGERIDNFDDLKMILSERIDFFDKNGCFTSDQSFAYIPFERANDKTVNLIFLKALNGDEISTQEKDKYMTELMIFLGREYAKRNWVMQLHTGCLRNNNSKMFNKIGRATGFDSINDISYAQNLSSFMNVLNNNDLLPKTIIYNLNPVDNYMIATMAGNFQCGQTASKVQFGAAWWFVDNADGMKKHLSTLANSGLLSKFVGMVTDSRSFLSYTRHEYFRRILCNLIGEWVEKGYCSKDMPFLGNIIKDIAFNNAVNYFNI